MLNRILTAPAKDVHIRQIMDRGQVFLVNLGKGQLGEDSSSLLAIGQAFGEGGPRELPIQSDGPKPFARWIDHIRTQTRDEDNLGRAIDLTQP